MFYGAGRPSDSSGNSLNAPRSRNERFDQMTKQEQLIEQKRREIEAKLAVDKQRKEMEELLSRQQQQSFGQSSSSSQANSSAAYPSKSDVADVEDTKPNLKFANDGSFFEQFKKLQEEQKKEKTQVKVKEEPEEYGSAPSTKKPLFKLLNPQTLASTSKTNNSTFGSTNKRYDDLPAAWAPPPPPPPKPEPNPILTPHPHVQQNFNKSLLYPPPPPPPPIPSSPQQQWQPPPQVKALAEQIADCGDAIEDMVRKTKSDDPLLWFLFRPDSKEYKSFRDLVIQIRNEKSLTKPVPYMVPPPKDAFPNSPESQNNPHGDHDMRLKRSASGSGNSSEEDEKEGSRKRRSRWGPQSSAAIPPPSVAAIPQVAFPTPTGSVSSVTGIRPDFAIRPPGVVAIPQPPLGLQRGPPLMLTKATRTNPQLLSYARQSYGTTDLDEEQWKQCEEAYKMNLLFQDIARKKARDEELLKSGKFKHEYDSDEEIDDRGTWEHKQRLKEMEKTKDWADELTTKAKGKHHIGDFLPPEELNKFMSKYKAVKEGRQMDESAYEDYKIAQDNVGFKLLQKMGWSDGQGLGSSGQGIVAPINEGSVSSDKQGLGVEKPDDITNEDDEYTAYRKRMMLAYRFRPNPLNNPRRAYY